MSSEQRKVSELSCLRKEWDEFTIDTCYDDQIGDLVFQVSMPDNAWFSIGFGASMLNTDMLAWFSEDGTGRVADYFSEGFFTPSEDAAQNWSEGEPTVFDPATKRMTFVTRRPLDTGDLEGDFVVKLNTAMPMCYASKSSTSKWSYHN